MRRQRGAAAVFAAISMILGLTCIALAVDLGNFYFARRDLQRVANMAALDAARVAGGCVGNYSNPTAAALAEVQQSVVRNGGQASWATGGVSTGSLNGFKAVRYFDTTFDPKQRSVRVKLTRPLPGRLIPIGASNDTMSATASAFSSPQATVKMGTKVVSVDTSGASSLNKLFTGLLGAPVNLDVLTYNAFLSAQVPVAKLLDRLDIGTPTQLANTPISQRALLGALVAQLNSQGSILAANAAQALYNVSSSSKTALGGQILGVANPVSELTLTAADVAMSVSQLTATGSLVSIPVGLPAPLNGVLDLSLVQPGVPTLLVPGGIDLFASNFASNTQLLARTTTTVPINLNVLGVVTANLTTTLPLFVQAGKGTAEIDHLDCKRRGQTQNLAYVRAQTSIVNIGLGTFSNINSPNPTPTRATILSTSISVLGIPVSVKVSALVSVPLASANTVLNQPFYEGETRHLGTPRVTAVAGGLSTADVSLQIDELKIIGNAGLLTSTVNGLLSATIEPLLKTLLGNAIVTNLTSLVDGSVLPILDSAGITAGGADVTVTNIESESPYLFTR